MANVNKKHSLPDWFWPIMIWLAVSLFILYCIGCDKTNSFQPWQVIEPSNMLSALCYAYAVFMLVGFIIFLFLCVM